MVLVTGATGHLGNTLVRLLLDLGESVRVMLCPGESTRSLDGLAVDRVLGNVLDVDSVARAVSGIKTVYHLAALISIRGRNALMQRVNVEGARNVASASLISGVRRFVHASSIHAFGQPDPGGVIDESRPFDPNNPAGDYDRSKAKGSLEVLDVAKRGLSVVIVCPTGIIGPNDFLGSEMGKTIHAWMTPKRHLMIDGSFDFVDVRDVAGGMISAARLGRPGEVYLLSGTRIALEEIRSRVQREMGVSKPSLRVGLAAASILSRFFAPIQRLIGRSSPLTRYAIETIREDVPVIRTKAETELRYHPRRISESIRNTVAWWKLHPTA